jgi:HlyD family type I secretion membrane fusion protein
MAFDNRDVLGRRGARLGVITIAGISLAFVAWAVAAPLDGAIVLQGFVKPALNRKLVQHQDGGVVSRLAVRDGDHVERGQTMLVLSGEQVVAEERILLAQQRALQQRVRRLRSELGNGVPTPAAATGEVDPVAHAERRALELGLRALAERQGSMDARVQAYAAQAEALVAKGVAQRRGGLLAEDEEKSNQLLEATGFVSRAYVTRMSRQTEDYRARLAETQADLSDVRQRMEALRAERALIAVERNRQVALDLSAGESALSEVELRLEAAVEARRRLEVRSPVAGTVVNLAVAGEGAYVAPRQALLGIVPADEPMVIEARVPSDQAPHVHHGQRVDLRPIVAGVHERRHVEGWVTYLSPDRLTDERTGQSYFVVRVTAMKEASGAVQSGLEFEVFIRTEPRTLAEYLLAPIRQAMRRTMREP